MASYQLGRYRRFDGAGHYLRKRLVSFLPKTQGAPEVEGLVVIPLQMH